MARKPRSDSKLDNLPAAKKLELRDGLLADWGYEEALSWLSSECGVTSVNSALTAFYKRHCKPVIKERRQLASMKAEVLGEEAGKTDWDKASIEKFKQIAFEVMNSSNADIKKVERMFRLLIANRAQDQNERKLDMLQDAARKAEEAEEVTKDDKLSGDEKQARLKLIFGIG